MVCLRNCRQQPPLAWKKVGGGFFAAWFNWVTIKWYLQRGDLWMQVVSIPLLQRVPKLEFQVSKLTPARIGGQENQRINFQWTQLILSAQQNPYESMCNVSDHTKFLQMTHYLPYYYVLYRKRSLSITLLKMEDIHQINQSKYSRKFITLGQCLLQYSVHSQLHTKCIPLGKMQQWIGSRFHKETSTDC